MRVHFIAIGGAAMHNLAIALHKKGYKLTGSDDEIFDPAASNLAKYGLLPESFGWFPEKITEEIDAIILGMHARKDNPELLRALEKKIKIFSYPEFLYEQTKNKKRIVIGGSHGKTTITSMIMFVLKEAGLSFDYMVGSAISGFDTMVNIEEKNNLAVFEGDEYLSSPLDLTPKFHKYKPHVAVISGIAWDHINVFPNFEKYVEQFTTFIDSIIPDGKLIVYKNDENLQNIKYSNKNIQVIEYEAYPYSLNEVGDFVVEFRGQKYVMSVFGDHNMQNVNAARLVCLELGIEEEFFWNTITKFKGAAKRLQQIKENANSAFYLDFAHAPSKVKATITAMKQKYPDKKLVACLELHTFSSLKKEFIPHYNNCMLDADIACVYYNPEVIAHKKLEEINPEFIRKSFGNDVFVFSETDKLQDYLLKINSKDSVFLMMSSGNFSGMDFVKFANKIIKD
ncbi:MAG TPA: Mur ligase family protein [Bacteroidales bacterium]|jgi:UDP-N-acetylmuramate: L-alanyl-gamma-D-glutamyl-meso-diaminopimelate ligase|nr:Mur ligase family protein [Bacteroidales bacterium]HOL97811.1 Mur ligase family protein [Bacteroidales bacterium]HOM35860.1 Mur ligase family protein [Bacteroidales bacterium]HPD23221.1 Mur ligase family protein [Bacteroidales bacterium]HRS99225.1 Mur ligase family protein [Bacteroidales bacterium]